MTITIRPATAADVCAFYGEPRRETLRAVMVIKDGAAVAIIGLKHEPGRHVLFADHRAELGADIKSFAVRRAIITMVRQALCSKLPLFAVAEPGSDVLPRLGFEQVAGDVYQWRS